MLVDGRGPLGVPAVRGERAAVEDAVAAIAALERVVQELGREVVRALARRGLELGAREEARLEARRLELLIDDSELQQRLAALKQSPPQRETPRRGYAKLFEDCVLQADQGCDFDFLAGKGQIPEPEIH